VSESDTAGKMSESLINQITLISLIIDIEIVKGNLWNPYSPKANWRCYDGCCAGI